ncbi:phospholipase D family protein [Yoonia sp. BS5-3]|uniref:Phospholipase D family protein n=1 Tax=Yoonia phaeophyticola TaxID=3137369 RepID=A0ABZ2VAT3_9RHOB
MTKKFILQGITGDSHLDEIRDAISVANVTRVVISVAFLTERGFGLLSDILKPIADKTVILAGIRNGITSAQGLLACVECGCKTYAVDTGSRGVVFHPKIYLGKSDQEARLVLGSANLTVGGLNSNIEASLKVIADMGVADEAALVADLEGKIDAMIADFPAHVVEVTTLEQVQLLLVAGRLTDESVKPAPSPNRSSGDRKLDAVPQMKLEKKKLKFAAVAPIGRGIEPAAPDAPTEDAPAQAVEALVSGAPASDHLKLVWESKALTRRALNIPTGENTARTGSMLFAKGAFSDIDQKHYFRDTVFAELDWQHDDTVKKEHLERSKAKFRIIIKDVNYGVFEMALTHDSRTDSPAYKQNNSMTQLHWGDVLPLVALEDLLDRTMFLYLDDKQPGLFVIEID